MLVELATDDALLGRADGDGTTEGVSTTTLTRPEGTEPTLVTVSYGTVRGYAFS